MSTARADPPAEPDPGTELEALVPMLRRIVGARVGGHPAAEDLVQETLVRVLAARDRIEPGMLEPYAFRSSSLLTPHEVPPAQTSSGGHL